MFVVLIQNPPQPFVLVVFYLLVDKNPLKNNLPKDPLGAKTLQKCLEKSLLEILCTYPPT